MASRIIQRRIYPNWNSIFLLIQRNSSNVPDNYKIENNLRPSEDKLSPSPTEIKKLSNSHVRDREQMKESKELQITSMFRGNVKQKVDKLDILQFETALQNNKGKEGFVEIIHGFRRKDKRVRGHLSFIYTAIKYLEPFGLEKDLDAYNEILDVFPKDKFVNRTLLDALWPKPHPQIDCAIEVLTLMEDNYCRPDDLTYTILLEVFGRASLPVQKAQRIAFWFDKYKDINPYLMDEDDLKDRFKVCKTAVERITNDFDNIKVYTLEDLRDNPSELMNIGNQSLPIRDDANKLEEFFIISSQNQEQRDFILNYDPANSLYIEGPFDIWMNNMKEEYFILRTGALSIPNAETHEDETKTREGMILGLCMTNLPIRFALENWFKYLQKDNKTLGSFNIIFNVEVPESLVTVNQ
eukprot:gene9362-10349_t